MSELTITLITAYTGYPTTNRAGKTNTSSTTQPFTLYSSLTPPSEESGPTTSTKCCTFQIDADLLPLQVEGVCNALSNLDNYVLKGVLDGTTIIQTGTLPNPGSQPIFTVPPMALTWNSSGNPLQFPCRVGGSIIWQIFAPGGSTPVASSSGTLLEMCFVWDGPPAGPNNPTAPNQIARPDFKNVFPIDLFRLFLPDISEFYGHGSLDYYWYLNRSIQQIWNLGTAVNPLTAGTRPLQYAVAGGNPSYVVNHYGGQFQLRRFIATLFGTVTCFDLAAITQLAVALIQKPQGMTTIEVLDSRWIYCEGYGYINQGPLFGWPQYPQCNSPFFTQGKPYYADPTDTDRQPFQNHAWIEVSPDPSTPSKRTVMDATHGLYPNTDCPNNGTQDRGSYLNAQLSPNNWVHTYSYNPYSRSQLIGVTTIASLPILPVPQPSSPPAEVDSQVPQLVNNAPCDAETVATIAKPATGTVKVESSDTLLSSAGCQILTNLSGTDKLSGELHIEITGLENHQHAINMYNNRKFGLVAILPPESLLSAGSLGPHAIRSTSEVLWFRGSVVARVFADVLQPGSNVEAISSLIFQVSQHLDSHLQEHAVAPGKEDRPAPALRSGSTFKTRVGERFSLQLDKVHDTHAVRIAEVEDPSVLLSTSLGGPDGDFEFLAMKAGKTKAMLSVAHRSNLNVTTKEVEVTITA